VNGSTARSIGQIVNRWRGLRRTAQGSWRAPHPRPGDDRLREVPGQSVPGREGPVTRRAAGLLRAGLAVLALEAGVQGIWMYLAPRSFYDDVPTVSASGPFSQHLMSDIGGLNLAMAVLLGSAAAWPDRRLARVALAAYLVYVLSHLAFHLTDLMSLSPGGQAFLLTALLLLPAVAIGLLFLTILAGPARVRSRG